MPQARTPSVEIRFGGETRHLIQDYNALAELQDLAGTYLSGVAHMKAVRGVLWALLLAETLDSHGRETGRTLSLHQVGEILADCSTEELADLVKAIQEARGIAEAPKVERPTEAPTPQS